MWRGCWKACWTPADRHPPYRTRQGTPMKHKPCLDLQDIKTIAQAAEAHATARGWAVSIAIADDGGHLLWLQRLDGADRKSTRLNSSHLVISYAVFCLKKKKKLIVHAPLEINLPTCHVVSKS